MSIPSFLIMISLQDKYAPSLSVERAVTLGANMKVFAGLPVMIW
jgi:hypothetical protein